MRVVAATTTVSVNTTVTRVRVAASPTAVKVTARPTRVAVTARPIRVKVSTVGQQGPPGTTDSLWITRTTAQILSGHRLVTTNDDGELIYADAATPSHVNRPVWLTVGAWAAGVEAKVLALGIAAEPSWIWTVGEALFLGLDGVLTSTAPPGSATFVRRVGEAIDSTTLSFGVQQPIVIS